MVRTISLYSPIALQPEQAFIASHPGPVTLSIRLPIDNSNPAWRLNGDVISVTIDISASVKTLKQQISDSQGGMPASKQQLKHATHGFLKDGNSLGYYNLVSGTELQLTVRSRGGRKLNVCFISFFIWGEFSYLYHIWASKSALCVFITSEASIITSCGFHGE